MLLVDVVLLLDVVLRSEGIVLKLVDCEGETRQQGTGKKWQELATTLRHMAEGGATHCPRRRKRRGREGEGEAL